MQLFDLLLPATSGKQFSFLVFYDDIYNFLEYPDFNSLAPYTLPHLFDLLGHTGINVYEPVGTVIKAAVTDLSGLDAHNLHYVSLAMHAVNSILIYIWVQTLFENNQRLQYKKSVSSTLSKCCTAVACSIFLIHPLNMEVIGWLSAQNYTFALLFSVFSSICLECALEKQITGLSNKIIGTDGKNPLQEKQTQTSGLISLFSAFSAFSSLMKSILGTEVSVLLFYVLSCLCKAPAVVLPGVHILRILLFTAQIQSADDFITSGKGGITQDTLDIADTSNKKSTNNTSSTSSTNNTDNTDKCKNTEEISKTTNTSKPNSNTINSNTRSASNSIFLSISLVISSFIIYFMISSANSDGGAVIPPFDSHIATLIRSVVTVSDFSYRFFVPTDLRGHYQVKEEEYFDRNVVTPSNPLFWQCILFIIFTLFTLTLVRVGIENKEGKESKEGQYPTYRDLSMITFGWCSYLILWLPGCGLVTHGWAQLGSDRYNYFPLAYVTPAIATVILSLLESDPGPILELNIPNDVKYYINASGQINKINGKKNENPISSSNNSSSSSSSSNSSSTDGNNSKKNNSKANYDISNIKLNPLSRLPSMFSVQRFIIIMKLFRFFCVGISCILFLYGLSDVSSKQLSTWINDKALLTHCVKMDPTDYDCHQYLGDWYGHHEKNTELGTAHTEQAIRLVPTSNAKALMFKGQMLLFLNRQDDACAVVDIAYKQLKGKTNLSAVKASRNKASKSPIPGIVESDALKKPSDDNSVCLLDKSQLKNVTIFERKMVSYVTNNWVLCQALKTNGVIDDIFARDALDLLATAMEYNKQSCQINLDTISIFSIDSVRTLLYSAFGVRLPQSSVPQYLTDGLANHMKTLQGKLDKTYDGYGASFIW